MAFAGCRAPEGAAAFDAERAVAAQSIAPNRIRRWHGDGVSLAWDADCRHAAANGRAALFDGHLHNRDDLVRQLGRGGEADLLLAGWHRWGEDVLDHFVGEFACVLWDGRGRNLLLGRDAIGCLPLHWHEDGARLLFAGEPRGLLTDPHVPRDLDEEGLVVWLSLLPDEGCRTVYRGIARVPPGHALLAGHGAARLHRYWRPEQAPLLRLGSDAAYEEALRAGLEEAVRCRLPAAGQVGAHLTGGYDSGANAVLAARLLAGQGRRLIAVTAVPAPGHAPSAGSRRIDDEGPAAALVAARHPNIDHVRVDTAGISVLHAADVFSTAAGTAMRSGTAAGFVALGREAQRRGVKVLLSGELGNLAASWDGLTRLPALLESGRLLTLAREAAAWRRDGGRLPFVAYHALAPFLPPRLVDALLHASGRALGAEDLLPPFSPGVLRRTGLAERLASTGVDLYHRFGRDGRAFRLAVANRADRGLARMAVRRAFGVEQTAPSADRRVFELCLSIPDEQFFRDGRQRSLFRRAFADLLPVEVLDERRKGQPDADWLIHFTAARAEFADELARLEKSPMAQAVLDLSRLRRLLEDWPSGPGAPAAKLMRCRYALGRGLAAGRFIRSFEAGND